MSDPVKKSNVQKRSKLKESPESSRREKETASSPKLGHKEKRAIPALSMEHKSGLKAAFDDLCRPLPERDFRVATWMKINARKDTKIVAWLAGQTEFFEDLVRFKPSQYLQCLATQKFEVKTASLYTNALIVSQSAFNSVSSYNAAYEVVKLAAKGVARSAEEVLSDMRRLNDKGIGADTLADAISDVGSKSAVVKGLLEVAAAMQDAELDDQMFAHEVNHLNLVLGRLAKQKKTGNPIRLSAPIGTIETDTLHKHKKTAPQPVVTFPEAAIQDSPRSDVPVTPRSGVKRDKSSGARSPVAESAAENKPSPQESSSESRDKEKEVRVEKHSRRKHKRDQSSGKVEPGPASGMEAATANPESPGNTPTQRPLPQPSKTDNASISRSTSGAEEGKPPQQPGASSPKPRSFMPNRPGQPNAAFMSDLKAKLDQPQKPADS